MGYMTDGLSFNTLREANCRRIDEDTNKFKKCETEWTPAHWMQATIGEFTFQGLLDTLQQEGELAQFWHDQADSYMYAE